MLNNINLLPNEEFRYIDLDGVEENRYLVSNYGRVVDTKFRGIDGYVRLKGLSNDKDGYKQVRLDNKTYLVHRLVAFAFLPNDDITKNEINHINEIKDDNRVENLEWCTRAYNNNYGTRNQRISKRVAQYNLNGSLIQIWPSTRECERNGFKHSNVTSCCNNKFHRPGNNRYKNFIWRYID